MNDARIPAGFEDCPDAETLAAYLDGTLEPAEREGVETHAAGCPDCRAILADTVRFLAHDVQADDPVPAPQSQTGARVLGFRPRWRSVVISVIAAAAALMLVVRLSPLALPGSSSRTDAALAALVEAVNNQPYRPLEARLSAGFAYRPQPVVTRGVSGRDVAPDVQIAASAVAVATTDETAAQQAALGLASLTTGDIDQGIAALERAVGQAPDNGAYLSDLAAAYLARAARTGSTDDRRLALKEADRALAANPSMPEALFNRALALDGLGMTQEAQRGWQSYLAVDPDSPWAAEARAKCRSC